MPDYAHGAYPHSKGGDITRRPRGGRYAKRGPSQVQQDDRETARKQEGPCPSCGRDLDGSITEYRGEWFHEACAWSEGNHDTFPSEEYGERDDV